MKPANLILFGIGIGIALAWSYNSVTSDISRGLQGYDSYFYRFYTPYTSPAASTEKLAQIRNLSIGEKAWIRSGAGCEYLTSYEYDPKWQHDLLVVHDVRSRWGLPCHEVRGWSRGSIIADGPLVFCAEWRARREQEGGGWVLRWTCEPSTP